MLGTPWLSDRSGNDEECLRKIKREKGNDFESFLFFTQPREMFLTTKCYCWAANVASPDAIGVPKWAAVNVPLIFVAAGGSSEPVRNGSQRPLVICLGWTKWKKLFSPVDVWHLNGYRHSKENKSWKLIKCWFNLKFRLVYMQVTDIFCISKSGLIWCLLGISPRG